MKDFLVVDLLTPLIAAISGSHDFSTLTFTINGSRCAFCTSEVVG